MNKLSSDSSSYLSDTSSLTSVSTLTATDIEDSGFTATCSDTSTSIDNFYFNKEQVNSKIMSNERSLSVLSDFDDSTFHDLFSTTTSSRSSFYPNTSILYTPSYPSTPNSTPRATESPVSIRSQRYYTSSPLFRPSTPHFQRNLERTISLTDLNKKTIQQLWVGLNNIVYDVSSNKGFYGPNQPLSMFAGQDTIAHASVNLFDLSYDMVSQLTFESDDLNSELNRKLNIMCHDIYMKKYPVIGRIR